MAALRVRVGDLEGRGCHRGHLTTCSAGEVCAAFPPRDMHASENCVAALADSGCRAVDERSLVRSPRYPGEQAVDLLARLGAAFVAVHPGSGSARKNAPAALFAALCRELSPTARWLLIEGPADEVAAAGVASVPGAVRTGALSLHALAAMLSRASLYVGNDSAVTHLAAALGVPTVALFGPTDPRTWAPVGPRVAFVAAPQGDFIASLSRTCWSRSSFCGNVELPFL